MSTIPELDFETLLHAERPRVLHFLRRLAPSEADAEDALQESCARAWRSRESFDPARGSFRSWLFRIAFRSHLDLSQRAQRAPSTIDSAQLDSASATRHPTTLDDNEELAHCLALLRPVEREILLRFHRDGLSIPEIAEERGMPAGTVKSHLHRARTRLRSPRDEEA